MPAGVRVDGEHGMVQITSETPNFRFLGRFGASEVHQSAFWDPISDSTGSMDPIHEARVFIQTDVPPLIFFPADTKPAWLSGIVRSGNGYWVSWTTKGWPNEILAFAPFSGPASGGLFEVYRGDGSLAFSSASRFLKIKAVTQGNSPTYVGTGPMAVSASCYPAQVRIGPSFGGGFSYYRTLLGVEVSQGYARSKFMGMISKSGAPVTTAGSSADENTTLVTIDTTGM